MEGEKHLDIEAKVLATLNSFISLARIAPEEAGFFYEGLEDNLFRQLLEDIRSELRDGSSHLPELYRRFLLPRLPKAPSLLFLGCGEGSELIHGRETFPGARIVGIDKRVSDEAVLAALFAETELVSEDLGMKSPDEIMRSLGMLPDAVIARHPSIGPDPIIKDVLTDWGVVMSIMQKPMLVTTYTQYEQNQILRSFHANRIFPDVQEFSGGVVSNIPFVDGTSRDIPQDRFLFML